MKALHLHRCGAPAMPAQLKLVPGRAQDWRARLGARHSSRPCFRRARPGDRNSSASTPFPEDPGASAPSLHAAPVSASTESQQRKTCGYRQGKNNGPRITPPFQPFWPFGIGAAPSLCHCLPTVPTGSLYPALTTPHDTAIAASNCHRTRRSQGPLHVLTACSRRSSGRGWGAQTRTVSEATRRT